VGDGFSADSLQKNFEDRIQSMRLQDKVALITAELKASARHRVRHGAGRRESDRSPIYKRKKPKTVAAELRALEPKRSRSTNVASEQSVQRLAERTFERFAGSISWSTTPRLPQSAGGR